LAGTVVIVAMAILTLTLAGVFFIADVDERAEMLAFARRLRS
jgi:hypothetical protein